MKDSVAKDVMTREVVAATPETTIEDAIKLLVNHRITGLPVVDGRGKLIGVLSEYDIIRVFAGKRPGAAGPLKASLLSKKIPFTGGRNVVSVKDTDTVAKVVNRFVKTRNRRLPVVGTGGKLVGMITRRDIIRMLFYRMRLP